MDSQRIVGLIGDGARPFGIVFLTLSLGIAMFSHVDASSMTVVAGVLSVFVGARSFENHTQIKADADVKKTGAGTP